MVSFISLIEHEEKEGLLKNTEERGGLVMENPPEVVWLDTEGTLDKIIEKRSFWKRLQKKR